MSLINLIVSSSNRALWLAALDRRRQNMRNPSRCHRNNVSGCTMARARRHVGNTAAARRSPMRSSKCDPWVGAFPTQDNDLLSQHGVLEDELTLRANRIDREPHRDTGLSLGI